MSATAPTRAGNRHRREPVPPYIRLGDGARAKPLDREIIATLSRTTGPESPDVLPSASPCCKARSRRSAETTRRAKHFTVQAAPATEIGGRDGQIRTADLSLRRRPLYPSELRPHTDPLSRNSLEPLLRQYRGGSAFRRTRSCPPPRTRLQIAAGRSAPDAVTPSTRPPAVSSRPCSIRVPA